MSEKQKPKITLSNISSYIEGNVRKMGNRLDMLPDHIKEQVEYRSSICVDCLEKGACKYCGCSVPGKLYVKKSCNKGVRFPDLMEEDEWEQYKKDNNIEID